MQTRVAGSRFSLPATAVVVFALWALLSLHRGCGWLPMLLTLCSTGLMVHMNTENALMRTFSNMVSCSFLVLSLMLLPELSLWQTGLAQLFCILGYIYLFRAYQNKEGMGYVFTAFAFLGAGAVFFPQLLFLVPVLWVVLGSKLMAMSLRTFLASLLGLLVPYWFWAGYLFFKQGDLNLIVDNIMRLAEFTPLLAWQSVPDDVVAITAFVFLVGLIGSVHFLRTSYNDKIRTRMLYEIFIIMSACLALFIVLQPGRAGVLLPLLTINVAPLIAHFITFTHTRLTGITFVVLILTALLLTAIHCL